jgi:hypothetical protein
MLLGLNRTVILVGCGIIQTKTGRRSCQVSKGSLLPNDATNGSESHHYKYLQGEG